MTVVNETPPRAETATAASKGPEVEFPTPRLGRSVRIVGPVASVDPSDLPHPRAHRGELGKAVYNWRHSTISPDPITRVAFETLSADPNNTLNVRKAPMGTVNPERTPVSDPAAMSRHIKRVARTLGLDVVAVGRSHPSFMYAGRTNELTDMGDDELENPETVVRKLPCYIVGSVAWDYRLSKAHRHHIGDAAYDLTGKKTRVIMAALQRYIQELGYHTLAGAMNGQAGAVAAGIGELGRNGLVITPKFGARIHANDTIMTDLPLAPDGPIDIGVSDFCNACNKCATTCPTNSITFGGKVVENGVEKYKINWLTCYKLRPFVVDHWANCLTCAVVCPYTKPTAWWHDAAIWALQFTPPPVRPVVVRALKWLADRIWGLAPRQRVRWLGYDSGIKPGERACTVSGCTAPHDEMSNLIPAGEVGYYAPLKENTNRFVKRG